MFKHIDRIVFNKKSKVETAPAVFFGLVIFGILTTVYYILLTDAQYILIRNVLTIGMLVSFVIIERSRLSVQAAAFLNPFFQVGILTVGAIIFDGDFLLYMYTLVGGMISLMYLKPKGLLLYALSIGGAQIILLVFLDFNLLGPNFTRPQQYAGLGATIILNLMIYNLCKSYTKAAHAKEVFLSNISHEIRTPISSVIGISDIALSHPDLPEAFEESFVRIHRSSKLLLRIINDILDFSKLQEGKMPILKERYDLLGLINDIHHPYYENAQYLDFLVDVDPTLPTTLEGDNTRIQQILVNLLSNAFKYTEKGHVHLKVHQSNMAKNKTTLLFTISDTGVGMTPSQLEAIYNDYTRFHANKNIGGTGLGMSIVQKLVQQMNGKLTIDSAKDQGTTVHVAIPQKVTNATFLGNYDTTRVPHQRQSEKKATSMVNHVLVVDDMEVNLYVARGLIEFYGITVAEASSGRQAIELVQAGNTYDIIFMDSMMPEMSGLEALLALRKLGYKGPVVALTADATAGTREDYLKQGFDYFLPKPIITEDLEAILKM